MSGLIWIQTVRHSGGIPERIFEKVDLKKISRRQKIPLGEGGGQREHPTLSICDISTYKSFI